MARNVALFSLLQSLSAKDTRTRLREYFGVFGLGACRTDDSRSDQVSDAILDACLAEDPLSKVGTLVSK